LLANGAPKLIFRELLRRKPFSEQRVEFFRYSREARHGPLSSCVAVPWVRHLQGREKMTSGKSNGLLVGELHALVVPIYINDNAEQQDCRDSVGL
jgi:hypothetical protein